MLELSLNSAKNIVAEPIPEGIPVNPYETSLGHSIGLFKFTRLLLECEVYHADEIATVQKNSHDLAHFAGIHKFRHDVAKIGELRWFWGMMWQEQRFLSRFPEVKKFIMDVCEVSAYKGGWSKRPLGLMFPGLTPHSKDGYPWRTPEWYEARKPRKIPYQKLTEFYPYISTTPNEDHELLLTIDSIIPKGLNTDMRADVCQDMIVAILSGEATLENIKGERPKYMKQFFKMFPTKYGHLALDAPAYRDSNGGRIVTLGETIAAEYK